MDRYPWRPLGDSALTFEAGKDAPGLANFLRESGSNAVVDVVAAFDTIVVYFDPESSRDPEEVVRLARSYEPRCMRAGASHQIPVWYEAGEDLGEVCGALGLTTEEFKTRHGASSYLCEAIGFCPGFPYLTGLDPSLGALGRKPTPRTKVSAGSVAIAAGMTGVYTMDRPGGWWLIGKTPLALVDPDDGYFPIAVGDRVRFDPIGKAEFDRREGQRL